MGCEVKFHWAYGDVTFGECMDVCVFSAVFLLKTACEPVVFLSVGVDALVELLYPTADGLTGDLDAFDVGQGELGDVDVQEGGGGHLGVEGGADDGADDGFGCAKVGFVGKVQEGEADAGDAFDGAFHGCGHGAGVHDGDGIVCSVVDA